MSHINEKLDFAIDALIVNNGRVLLQKHEKSNDWWFPGGHIETDEDPTEALLREVKEETGLEVNINFDENEEFIDETINLPPPDFINRHFIGDSHEHVSFLYVVTTEDTTINPAQGEMNNPENFKWLSAEEINQSAELKPMIKFYALKALEKINN